MQYYYTFIVFRNHSYSGNILVQKRLTEISLYKRSFRVDIIDNIPKIYYTQKVLDACMNNIMQAILRKTSYLFSNQLDWLPVVSFCFSIEQNLFNTNIWIGKNVIVTHPKARWMLFNYMMVSNELTLIWINIWNLETEVFRVVW